MAEGTGILPSLKGQCHDTGGKFAAGIVDTGGKFANGVVDTGGAP